MLLVAASAAAYSATWESVPQPVAYDDEAQAFTSVQLDTGYWPSATDPIAVRFYLTPTGAVTTHLEGTSRLEWPELAHQVAGEPGGSVAMHTGLAIGAEVKLDLLGVFTGVVPLASRSVAFDDAVDVDGLLLPGEPPATLGDQAGSVPPLDYAISVVPGVTLVLGVNLLPTVELEASGLSVTSTVGDQALVQVDPDGWSSVDPDPGRPGELGVVSTWDGELSQRLSLVLEPHVDVDTLIGSFTLASFPIPVDLVDEVAARTSGPAFVVHPLPVLEPAEVAHDFGALPAGDLATWELALDNLGAGVLQGAATIEGDPAFSVWPDALAALPEVGDGLTVTFAPPGPGDYAAELWLATNDPWEPVVRIALTGSAVGPDGPGDEPGTTGAEDPQKYCGCAETGSAAGAWAGLATALVSARRRRPGPAGASRTSGPPRRR